MYAASAPAALRSKYKELDLLLNKTFNPEEPFVAIDVLQATNGTAFTAFAKNGRLNKGEMLKFVNNDCISCRKLK